MKLSQVATALRELAERFEQIDIDDEGELYANLRLNFHHVDTRKQLLKLMPLVNGPTLSEKVPCISNSTTRENPAEITLYIKPGILGGERREVFVDTQAGLDAIVAEQSDGRLEYLMHGGKAVVA